MYRWSVLTYKKIEHIKIGIGIVIHTSLSMGYVKVKCFSQILISYLNLYCAHLLGYFKSYIFHFKLTHSSLELATYVTRGSVFNINTLVLCINSKASMYQLLSDVYRLQGPYVSNAFWHKVFFQNIFSRSRLLTRMSRVQT